MELKKEFRKGLSLSLEYQYRRNQNLSNFQASYFSISPSYKINRNFNTSAEFRYGTSTTWDRFRYAYYVGYKTGIKDFGFSLRTGYLFENFKQELQDIDQFPATHSLRFRVLADYDITKRLKVSLSSEPIFSLEHSFNMRQMRNILEFDYEFFKNQVISASYLHMPQFSDFIYTGSNHILQLKYVFVIPKHSKI